MFGHEIQLQSLVGYLLGGVEYLNYGTVILYGINSWFALLVLILYQVLLFVRGRAAETSFCPPCLVDLFAVLVSRT